MTHHAFSLFNTKQLFHSTATQGNSVAIRHARRRLARLLAASCANDATDVVPDESAAQPRDEERRFARRD
jgi:hypothetical protein